MPWRLANISSSAVFLIQSTCVVVAQIQVNVTYTLSRAGWGTHSYLASITALSVRHDASSYRMCRIARQRPGVASIAIVCATPATSAGGAQPFEASRRPCRALCDQLSDVIRRNVLVGARCQGMLQSSLSRTRSRHGGTVRGPLLWINGIYR